MEGTDRAVETLMMLIHDRLQRALQLVVQLSLMLLESIYVDQILTMILDKIVEVEFLFIVNVV